MKLIDSRRLQVLKTSSGADLREEFEILTPLWIVQLEPSNGNSGLKDGTSTTKVEEHTGCWGPQFQHQLHHLNQGIDLVLGDMASVANNVLHQFPCGR